MVPQTRCVVASWRRRLADLPLAVAAVVVALVLLAPGSSEAGTKWQKQEQKRQDSLTCYQCNSLYDERCADPFSLYSLSQVECNLKTPPAHLNRTLKPTLCRKIVQKVYGKTRVIRGCGYVPDDKHGSDCFKRSGTHDVTVVYCSCNTSFCNGAWGLPSSPPVVALGTVSTVLLAPLINLLHWDDHY